MGIKLLPYLNPVEMTKMLNHRLQLLSKDNYNMNTSRVNNIYSLNLYNN